MKYGVFRPAPDLPEGFMPSGMNGMWVELKDPPYPPFTFGDSPRATAYATGRFETREDRERAEVFEVRMAPSTPLRNGVQRVALERRRQTERGYTLAHDRENMRPAWLVVHARRFIAEWFRETDNTENLAKAGALIAAALDVENPSVVHAEGIDPRRFLLVRHTDVSGVSGTGVVAEGIEFSDGLVALHWRGDHPSIVTWTKGMESVEAIHGHNGATTVEWLD